MATGTAPAAVLALTARVCRAMLLAKLTISTLALLAVGAASLLAFETVAATWAKPKPIALANPRFPAPGEAEPSIPTAHSSPEFQVSPPTREILIKLQERIDMVFRRDTPLDDVLKYVTRTTKKANRSNDPGIPFYVDPFGLAEAQKTLTSSVKIDVTGVPLKVTIPRVLAQLSLAYVVDDGVVLISSSARIPALQERKVLLARDDSPKTMPLLTKLDEPIALSFPAETPLNDVLRYIKTATATQDSLGIPIYVDPAGLREVDRAVLRPSTSTSRCAPEDVASPDRGTAPPVILRPGRQRDHQLAHARSAIRGDDRKRTEEQEGSGPTRSRELNHPD